jgi:hypothetical protein
MHISTARRSAAPPLRTREEEPAPPSEELDFSTIDSAQEAALLPALHGPSLLVMLSALEAEAQWSVSLTSIQENTWNGSTHGFVRCHGESGDGSQVTLRGEGTLGGVPLEEAWSLDRDNGVVRIDGTVGWSREALVMSDAHDGSRHLDGTVGEVEVHEVLRREQGQLLIDGTLNGVEHHQALKINEDALPFAPPATFRDVIVAGGSLGGAPLTLNVDAIYPPHMPVVTYEERGTIGGVGVESSHTLQISPLSPAV